MEKNREAQHAAARLLEFSRQIGDLPLHAPANRRGPYGQALSLVQDLDKALFEKAIVQLRLAFLDIDQGRDPRGKSDVSSIQLNSAGFLEWLTRLDLHQLNIQGECEEKALLENRERWLLLDQAFGSPDAFWQSFQSLRVPI